MDQYLDLLSDCLHGVEKTDRTGTGTYSQFGRQLRFDLSKGFPILTTKKLHWKSIVGELLWFLEGATNAHYLKQKYGVSIWDEWADKDGHLGPIYGQQWRSWGAYLEGNPEPCAARPQGGPYHWHKGVDQIATLVKGLKENPDGRRHIVSAWNVQDIPRMALPPCHVMFQCYVTPKRELTLGEQFDILEGKMPDLRKPKLSLQMYQRSADVFLGVPFNIASYALLTHILAHVCGYDVGEYVHTFGDVHLYKNHIKQCVDQLARDPKELPKLIINSEKTDIFSFAFEDFTLEGYDPEPNIPAPVAV